MKVWAILSLKEMIMMLIDRKCKLCDTGELSLKNSFRGGAFIGCSNYPECKFTRPLSKSKASQQINLG